LKNQKVYKLDVKNENVQNTVNEHETNKSERKNAESFFFQEIFWNSASDIEMGLFYTYFEMGT
jgi:hypothetical protein